MTNNDRSNGDVGVPPGAAAEDVHGGQPDRAVETRGAHGHPHVNDENAVVDGGVARDGRHPSADDHGHEDHDHGDHDHDHRHRAGFRGAVLSVLKPHSHDAADSIDTALTASAEGMRTLKISLGGLAVTALVQVVIFAGSGSVALLADTIHNFADALTAIPLAAAFILSRRAATRRYTYGYARAEDLAGIFIVVTITASSVVAAWEAFNRLVHPQQVHQIGWVIVAGLVGFVGNEAVAHYRIRVGRRIGSAALEADGYHARTDGFTSLAVVVGAIGVAAGWQLADPLVGLVITVAILAVVKNAAREVYRRLMDAVDPALVERVGAVLGRVDGVDGVDSVRIRWIGHELYGEAEVTSDAGLSLFEAHEIAEHAHHRLLHAVPRLAQVTIHTSPSAPQGADPHGLTAHHHARSWPPGHVEESVTPRDGGADEAIG